MNEKIITNLRHLEFEMGPSFKGFEKDTGEVCKKETEEVKSETVFDIT